MTQQEMEAIWAEHIRHEFVTRDVEATLATMVEDASVNHVPVTTGGKGKTALRAFYRDVFIGSWPDDLQMTTTNRVFGQDQLVEEAHLRFTHKNRMDWFLPGVPADASAGRGRFRDRGPVPRRQAVLRAHLLGPGDGPAPDGAGEGVGQLPHELSERAVR